MQKIVFIILLFITVSLNSQTTVVLVLPDNCNVPTMIEKPLVEKNLEILKIYPNPNSGSFYVYAEFSSPLKKAEINISDLKGNILRTESVYCNSEILIKQITVNDLPEGTYVIELITDKHRVSDKFLIAN